MECQKCKNESICKYIEDAKNIVQSVKAIGDTVDKDSPLSVSVRCDKFASNIVKIDCSGTTNYLNQTQRQVPQYN